MRRRLAFVMVVSLAPTLAVGAEPFRNPSESETRRRLATMEVTDGVHWAEIYHRAGSVTVWGLGKKSRR